MKLMEMKSPKCRTKKERARNEIAKKMMKFNDEIISEQREIMMKNKWKYLVCDHKCS